jgi:hypothetical protein
MELTMRLVTTPIKQAIAKKINASWVLVEIFITYKLPKIETKVNKKILALLRFIW